MVKKGNCLEIACKNIIDMKNWLFCYAKVMGRGELKGRRILHAWNEHQDLVFDLSNGNKIVMRKEEYYKKGKIKEKDVTKKTANEVIKLMIKHKTYGGWIK